MVCECKDTTSVGIDQMFCGFFFEKTLIFLLLGRNGVVWRVRVVFCGVFCGVQKSEGFRDEGEIV